MDHCHTTDVHRLMKVSSILHPLNASTNTRRLEKIAGMVDAYAGATGWIRLEFNRNTTNEHTLLETIESMDLAIKQLASGYQHEPPYMNPGDNDTSVNSRVIEITK